MYADSHERPSLLGLPLILASFLLLCLSIPLSFLLPPPSPPFFISNRTMKVQFIFFDFFKIKGGQASLDQASLGLIVASPLGVGIANKIFKISVFVFTFFCFLLFKLLYNYDLTSAGTQTHGRTVKRILVHIIKI